MKSWELRFLHPSKQIAIFMYLVNCHTATKISCTSLITCFLMPSCNLGIIAFRFEFLEGDAFVHSIYFVKINQMGCTASYLIDCSAFRDSIYTIIMHCLIDMA